jgi:ketosteroid isomerase-like protein
MWSRRWSCLLLSSVLSVTFVLAEEPAPPSNAKLEDQVLQLERDWLAADGKGDAARLREIIADDFVGSSFDGELLSKSDIIPIGGGRGGFAGAVPTKTNVRVFGDTGVLMGVINNPESAEKKSIRVTLVCQKRAQGWQIVAAQLSQ